MTPDFLASLSHTRRGRIAVHDARHTLAQASRQVLELDALARVLGALDQLELAERELVAGARDQGATWEAIGQVYGVTRQAAFKRFGGGSEVDSERAS